ncbi:Uncharacterized protein dnm_074120 [Desulfonema magnum]|uniref:Uncharacterized protein n=1 Tax=Desulfonema magnum TaxID=45655 RepID=A0A975GRX8_9BACT|nr:Uncharacterized protein dnm_074120 [Desulfonema magnum]
MWKLLRFPRHFNSDYNGSGGGSDFGRPPATFRFYRNPDGHSRKTALFKETDIPNF